MARRWWKTGQLAATETRVERGSVLKYEAGWQSKMAINALGTLVTGVIVVVFAITKFSQGAWIVLILLPALVLVFFRIHRHYRHLASRLTLENYNPGPPPQRHRVILPVSGVHQGTLAALQYAQLLSPDVTAVHISTDPASAERVEQRWQTWGQGVRLVIVESPYRLMQEPLLRYIRQLAAARQPNEIITVVVPSFVPHNWFDNLLHTQTATFLRLALIFIPGVIVVDVPYQVD